MVLVLALRVWTGCKVLEYSCSSALCSLCFSFVLSLLLFLFFIASRGFVAYDFLASVTRTGGGERLEWVEGVVEVSINRDGLHFIQIFSSRYTSLKLL